MNYLNYFTPYVKSSDRHEDHLTRAFLLLLKMSPSSFTHFYTYFHLKANSTEVPPLHDLEMTDLDFQTQTRSLPEVNKYFSVLITNEFVPINTEVKPSKRTAVYDGVINISDDVVLFIENKPNKDNVWTGQLSPSKKDIPEEGFLFKEPIILEWKEILNQLHRINNSVASLLHERHLISDFFELVNKSFSYLKPYDDFSKCTTPYLYNQRVKGLLESIQPDHSKIKHHKGWGNYIELDIPEVKKIGVLNHFDKETGRWSGLYITLDFGSTMTQSRSFYKKISSYQAIENYIDWKIYGNLHLAFSSSNLVFFDTPEERLEEFFNFFSDKKERKNRIRQIPKVDLGSFLNDLKERKIIILTRDKEQEVEEKIFNKGYTTINLCPAILMRYFIPAEKAIKLDKQGELIEIVKSKIQEILELVDHRPDWCESTKKEEFSEPELVN